MTTAGIQSSAVSSQLDALSTPVDQSNVDSQILSSLGSSNAAGGSSNQDAVSISVDDLYNSLTVFSKQVVDKLQEILKGQLPNGLQSLAPEDNTPEKTADRIVQGTTAFLPVFAKQHPDLQGEELLSEFMKTIRSGIEQGYGQAESTLTDIGAFKIDGVKDGIEKTKQLVEQGLQAFEDSYRKQNLTDSVAADTAAQVEKSAGASAIASAAPGQLNVYEVA
ncbi:MAG: DUF5610 domain-containing protein [Bdellovibrionota bacterium]